MMMLICIYILLLQFTFETRVTVPKELVAITSAIHKEDPLPDAAGKKTYHSVQDKAVPTYLLSLFVGKLDYKAIGTKGKVGVWAETSLLEKTAAAAVLLEDINEVTMCSYYYMYHKSL